MIQFYCAEAVEAVHSLHQMGYIHWYVYLLAVYSYCDYIFSNSLGKDDLEFHHSFTI